MSDQADAARAIVNRLKRAEGQLHILGTGRRGAEQAGGESQGQEQTMHGGQQRGHRNAGTPVPAVARRASCSHRSGRKSSRTRCPT